jgi:hypothetical protein
MLTSTDRYLLGASAGYVVLLVLFAALLPYAWVKPWLSEAGPFEVGALLAWIGAAALLAVRIRPFTARTLAFVTICLLCAAREADLHKAFTLESISRLSYYRKSAAPLAEKLIAGCVALLFVALLAYAGLVAARFLFRQGGLRSRSGFWLMFSAALLVLTKTLDRTTAVLARIFDTALPAVMQQITAALEEGLEAAVPLAFVVSAWISQREGSYLSADSRLGPPAPIDEAGVGSREHDEAEADPVPGEHREVVRADETQQRAHGQQRA